MEFKELVINKLWSIEAEAGVIGSMMLNARCIPQISLILAGPEDFYLPEHQIIYKALSVLFSRGEPTDAIALRTELKSLGALERVGGVEYIERILQSVPFSTNAEYYASVVAAHRQYRDMHIALNEMEKVLEENITVSEQRDAIRNLALGLKESKEIGGVEFKHNVKEAVASIADCIHAVRTGFVDLDFCIDGFFKKELVILAGRPGMGKSALALNIAVNVAQKGMKVVIVSLEMGAEALMQRAAVGAAQVNIKALRTTKPSLELQSRALEAADRLESLEIIIFETAVTSAQIEAIVATRGGDIGLLIIDHIQLMTANKENRVQEISSISRALKMLAMRYGVPVLAVSQLSRAVEMRGDKRPHLSDLRDSGSIEQDADLVLMLYRADHYRKQRGDINDIDGLAEVIVSKNRRGPTGDVKLVFREEYAHFYNLKREENE